MKAFFIIQTWNMVYKEKKTNQLLKINVYLKATYDLKLKVSLLERRFKVFQF